MPDPFPKYLGPPFRDEILSTEMVPAPLFQMGALTWGSINFAKVRKEFFCTKWKGGVSVLATLSNQPFSEEHLSEWCASWQSMGCVVKNFSVWTVLLCQQRHPFLSIDLNHAQKSHYYYF